MTAELTELVNLRIFKEDAIERMEENERVLKLQKERIETLEYHLGRCRDNAYQMCYSTVGLLPIGFEADAAPGNPAGPAKKPRAKKAVQL